MALDLTVNRLSAPTWHWLGMNDHTLTGMDVPVPACPAVEGETSPAEGWDDGPFAAIQTGMGRDMDLLVRESGAEPVRLNVPAGEERTVRIHLRRGAGENQLLPVEVLARAGSRLTLLMDYTSDQDEGGMLAVRTRLVLEENAQVKLVQLQLQGDNDLALNDVGAVCADGAKLRLVQLFLGAAETCSGCCAALDGKKSALEADTGYLGRNRQHIDFNYEALHRGKGSKSELRASGVLRDAARKLLRGTIDFQKGAAGAEGDEREEVLLLNEGVVNQTVPLILCAEEDVEGNHGATIGQLDEDLLFYLMSRGMSAGAVENMVARARVEAICQQIGDEAAEGQLHDYLEEVFQ
ncbi:MAG: SufD family Fe-S cluster assembly protein [Clostridiales bacterium]|nr:SufD family Fe-S cluster assembly protein [Clostridiales bacterium]